MKSLGRRAWSFVGLGLGSFLLLWTLTTALATAPAAALRGYSAQFRGEVSRLSERVPAGWPSARGDWEPHVRWVNELLDRGDLSAATFAWRDAYGAALDGSGWEGLIAVGDAFVRLADLARVPHGARDNARQAYLAAFIRAERAGSVDGIVRTASAFARLGEYAVSEQCLRIATRLAASRGDRNDKDVSR